MVGINGLAGLSSALYPIKNNKKINRTHQDEISFIRLFALNIY